VTPKRSLARTGTNWRTKRDVPISCTRSKRGTPSTAGGGFHKRVSRGKLVAAAARSCTAAQNAVDDSSRKLYFNSAVVDHRIRYRLDRRQAAFSSRSVRPLVVQLKARASFNLVTLKPCCVLCAWHVLTWKRKMNAMHIPCCLRLSVVHVRVAAGSVYLNGRIVPFVHLREESMSDLAYK
jgi:hypothetical protein